MSKYSLDSIVKEILIEIGDSDMNRYARFYQYGVSFLRSANMDTSGVPKVVELSINDNDTADLPNDYMNYSRIALCGRDGKLHSLGRNENICLNKNYDDCGNPVAHQQVNNQINYGIGFYPWNAGFIRNGEVMGGLFGIGGGNNVNGEFRIDLTRGQIVFSNLLCHTSSVVMEYIADLEAEGNDFAVHPFLVQACKAWMRYQSLLNNKNAGLGAIQMAERVYFREDKQATRRFQSHTNDEWIQAFRAGNQAAPKF
jgi:hypothetical protein